jgi:hypothetical protein
MKTKDVKKLGNGDEVYWDDPDNGACSRYITIQTITIEEGSDIVSIYGKDGDHLECFAHELS